jgi:hypothetical protein
MILALLLLLAVAATKPCPYDGETARFFAERTREGKQQCGYSHDHYDPTTGKHFFHVFWTGCS